MWSNTEHAKRTNGPVLAGAALGLRPDEQGDIHLNTAESATCPRCGAQPRQFITKSPNGNNVVVWIPLQHQCRGR